MFPNRLLWNVTATAGAAVLEDAGNFSRWGFAVGGSGSQAVLTWFLVPSLLSLLCFRHEVRDSSASYSHHHGVLPNHRGQEPTTWTLWGKAFLSWVKSIRYFIKATSKENNTIWTWTLSLWFLSLHKDLYFCYNILFVRHGWKTPSLAIKSLLANWSWNSHGKWWPPNHLCNTRVVWEDHGAFRRWKLARGSMSLVGRLALRDYGLVPFPVLYLQMQCDRLDLRSCCHVYPS